MNLLFSILVGLREIGAHKFRSGLTMLGIILGVCSLVGMFALVDGMTEGMYNAMAQIGGLEKVSVVSQAPPVSQEHLADMSPGLTLRDADMIAAQCPLVATVAPSVELNRARLVCGGNSSRPRQVAGVTPAFMEVENHVIAHGRSIHDLDVALRRRVCVLGMQVLADLFPPEPGRAYEIPLGKQIAINNQLFTIVGVLDYYESQRARKQRNADQDDSIEARLRALQRDRSQRHGMNWMVWRNDCALIPLSTMQDVMQSGARDGLKKMQLTEIAVRVIDTRRLDEAMAQVRSVLMASHRGIEDFTFNTREFWADRIDEETRNATRTGGLIAGISLVVGGIGIMNIMLASISERIREIGIRKAVGARHRDIFLQILTESVVLSALGGLVGLVAAFGLVKILGALAPFEYTPIVQPQAMVVALLFSATIGALAGLYPAFKAARLDPISALRYE